MPPPCAVARFLEVSFDLLFFVIEACSASAAAGEISSNRRATWAEHRRATRPKWSPHIPHVAPSGRQARPSHMRRHVASAV